MRRLFIHATNVHQGGGKALLNGLIRSDVSREGRMLLLDSRMALAIQDSEVGNIKWVYPSVLQRFLAECWLARHVREEDTILCFGNLPPLFKLAGHVIVFVQNKYLLESVCLADFSWKTKLRLSIERLWFRLKASNVNQFVVQTPSMKSALESLLDGKIIKHIRDAKHESGIQSVQVLPFTNTTEGYQRKLVTLPDESVKDFDFLYVASGEPHKNHRRLIEAWCLLAEDGRFPSLCVTLDKTHFHELCEWIDGMGVRYGLNLWNVGVLPHDQVQQLYRRAGALIYPSTFESFGLPLIEARQAGLPVLASEMDYVRDVLDPEQTFDPNSSTSIARAIKRFIGVVEPPLPLQNATEFLSHVLGEAM